MQTKTMTLDELTQVAFRRWRRLAKHNGRVCKCKIIGDVLQVCDSCRIAYNKKHAVLKDYANAIGIKEI